MPAVGAGFPHLLPDTVRILTQNFTRYRANINPTDTGVARRTDLWYRAVRGGSERGLNGRH